MALSSDAKSNKNKDRSEKERKAIRGKNRSEERSKPTMVANQKRCYWKRK